MPLSMPMLLASCLVLNELRPLLETEQGSDWHEDSMADFAKAGLRKAGAMILEPGLYHSRDAMNRTADDQIRSAIHLYRERAKENARG